MGCGEPRASWTMRAEARNALDGGYPPEYAVDKVIV
jgi:hypothetical protein